MTIEEIKKKAQEDPEFRKSLVLWSKDTDEGKELLTNHAKAEVDKAIGEKIAELHLGYDNDIFSILGERKEANQKSYDFVKQLVTELKELRGKGSDDKEQKITELEGKIKEMQESGEINDYWKGIYEKALSTWEEKEQGYTKQIEEAGVKFTHNQIETVLAGARGGLKFKEGIPEEAITAIEQVNREKILKHAKVVDGKVSFFKEDGTPWLDEEYKPITAQGVMKEIYGNILDSGTPSGGGSAQGGGAKPTIETGSIQVKGEGDNATKRLELDKNSFSTKLEFQQIADKTLKKQGVMRGNPEYQTLMDGAYEEYGVKDMDLK